MLMKSRVTLTVDPKISHRAKDVARRRGISLSALVEKLLAETTDPSTVKHPAPFSQRWKGKMKLASNLDSRSKRLHAKYKLRQ
jgi:antitoxin component of RelBE/YafQ-DinJ toxin-antitoxin module